MNNFTQAKFFILLACLTLFHPGVYAQEKADEQAQDTTQIENYREQIKRLMGFLEFSLNTLGDPETSTKEKEIIINESYLKAFLHEKVQVEDDLDENREIFTYKDVQAYLKDVDFFFKSAEFDFTVQDIQSLTNDQGMVYFKVIANRNLKGVTVDDEPISNNKTRYVEINLDDEEQVLKIASIYTTRLNEAAEMMAWWNAMPVTWKDELGSGYVIFDDIRLHEVDFLSADTLLYVHLSPQIIEIPAFIYIGDDSLLIMEKDTAWTEAYDTIAAPNNFGLRMLKEISEMETLDLSGNTGIDDLSPVSQMTGIKTLNISGTGVHDLFPARNLNKLVSLNITGTNIDDLDPIRYNTLVRELFIDSTGVSSLEPVEGFSSLELLHLSGSKAADLSPVRNLSSLRDLRLDYTPVSDLSPVADLINLENLSFSSTGVNDLTPLQYLVTLRRIFFENTMVSDLSPLARLENLQLIDADITGISDLQPLSDLASLEKVYCDKTQITRQKANLFMESHPAVLVIYESEGLLSWWSLLDPDWQTVFRGYTALDDNPTREQLHKLTLIKKLDIEGNRNLADLIPVSKLANLKEVVANHTLIVDLGPLSEIMDVNTLFFAHTPVSDLKPLQSLIYLENLDFSGTRINTLEGLDAMTGIKVIRFDNTGVSDLGPLEASRDIRLIYCDSSNITKTVVDPFLDTHPSCLVVYQTQALQNWWNGLAPVWKTIFRAHTQVDDVPTREQLHTVANLNKLDISGNRDILSLEPIGELTRLEELDISNSGMNDLFHLQSLARLKRLNISGNPVDDLAPLANLAQLLQLDISNTSVSRIDFLKGLTSLEQLNISGTQVKKLDPLAMMMNLKRLECYNTPVNNLKPVTGLIQLRYLACYNTKLSAKKVASFQDLMPGTEVVFY